MEKFTLPQVISFDPSTQALMQRLMVTPDAVGLVLRCHLLAEKALNCFLERKVVGAVAPFLPKQIRNYGDKLAFSVAFGLPVAIAAAFHQLNVLRNKAAHGKAEEEINAGDVLEFGRKVDAIRGVVPDMRTMPDHALRVNTPDFREVVYRGNGSQDDLLFAFVLFHGTFILWNQREEMKEAGVDDDCPSDLLDTSESQPQ